MSRTLLQFIAVGLLAAIMGGAAVVYFFPARPQPQVHAPQSYVPPPPIPEHPALPRMEVIAQYSGPLQDTLIQRLRDPIDGTTCYVYLPIAVHHTPPTADTGYVEYGSNAVGSISCFAAPRAAPSPAPSGR